jgi:hypothetical protein
MEPVEFRLVPPIHILSPFSAEDRAYAEKMGFVFGPVARKDPLAYLVQIPEGWSEITTSTTHRRFERDYLVDQDGEHRVLLHDNGSFMITRYTFNNQRISGENTAMFWVEDKKRGDGKYKPHLFDAQDRYGDDIKTGNDECRAWLDEHYPDWKDPAAYWQDP